MKLRTKYSVYITLLLILVLVPLLFVALDSIRRTFNEEMERKAEILSKITSESALPGFLSSDFGYFLPIIDGMDQEQDIVFIRLRNSRGSELFVRTSPGANEQKIKSAVEGAEGFGQFPVYLNIEGERFIMMRASVSKLDETLGTIDIIYSLERIAGRISDFVLFYLLISGMIIVVGALTAFWLSNRLADPLVKISQEVSEIGKGKLGRQIEYQSRDELNMLVGSINKMSTDLQHYQEEAIQNSRLAAIGEFSVWIAHELKTPLISLKPYLERPEELESDPEFLKEFRMAVKGFQEKLTNFSAQIKAFTKDQTYEFQDTDSAKIVEIIDKVMSDLRSELSAKRVTTEVTQKGLESSLRLNIDSPKIEQVISNLVLNSIDAMDNDGRIDICLASIPKTGKEIKFESPNGLLSIAISDTGVGMDKETVAKVFKKFFTTKASGTGLGLSWCFRIVRAHGGDILVESEKDVGTTFEVILPALGDKKNGEKAVLESNQVEK